MKDYWLRLGCFLTGYNYSIVKSSTEASAKAVKKYLSAMLIVCILWGFIGYVFSNRYLQTGILGSVIVSLVMVIIIVQIERQIILTTHKNWLAIFFRIMIAVVMAIIGSVIIDQIIFKQDIEKQKISKIQEEVNGVLVTKTVQLDREVSDLDSLIGIKERERAELIAEVTRHPFVKGSTSERKNIVLKITDQDGRSRDTLVTKTDLTLTDVVNPKAELIQNVDQQITGLRTQKSEKEKSRITIRQDLENELKSKIGFLDELKVLLSILTSHGIALFVWLCLFIFFFSIELFVLVSKFWDKKNDYDVTILHQLDVRIKMIEELTNQYSKSAVKD